MHREQGRTLHPQKNPNSNMTAQNHHHKLRNTTIADRLKTVSWSNDRYYTGVIEPVYGIPTFQLTEKAV